MTDSRLRDLERRLGETNSPEDELAWLKALLRAGEKLSWESYCRLHALHVGSAADYLRRRVETGDLTPERLGLAALCGHEAALRLAPQPDVSRDWLHQVAKLGPDELFLSALGLCKCVYGVLWQDSGGDMSLVDQLTGLVVDSYCEGVDRIDALEQTFLDLLQSAANPDQEWAARLLVASALPWLDEHLDLAVGAESIHYPITAEAYEADLRVWLLEQGLTLPQLGR